MIRRLFSRQLNYALVLLLFSLLVYSSIGLCLVTSPVQADTLPTGEEDVPVLFSCSADIDVSTLAVGLLQ
jgi:hypothetical protein